MSQYWQTLSCGLDDDRVLYVECPPSDWEEKVSIKVTDANLKNPKILFEASIPIEDCELIGSILMQTVRNRQRLDKKLNKGES